MTRRPRVLHVISDLTVGGAEMNLLRLLRRMDQEPAVVSLKTVGPIGERIQALGIPVHALGLRGGIPDPRGVLRLARRIRTLDPDVIQGWMYHGNLFASLAAVVARSRAPVNWNLRQSTLDPRRSRRTTVWTARVGAWLSRRQPAVIVCCSDEVRRVHADMGYDPARMRVIHNGVDGERFSPDAAARRDVRAELAIPDDAPVMGIAGRWHPQKDFATFLAAAARVQAELPETMVVACGDGVEPGNAELVALVRRHDLEGSVRLLGRRDDLERVYPALDLLVSSSAFGEGFPNTVAEAMAAGVPAVATDVGDSATLVGAAERVVPPRDPEALASACLEILGLESAVRVATGLEGRARLLDRFSMERAVREYDRLYAGD